MAEKRDLLSRAVLTRDSDVIWPAILFLEATLAPDAFHGLVVRERDAYAFLCAHYTRAKDYTRLTTLRLNSPRASAAARTSSGRAPSALLARRGRSR